MEGFRRDSHIYDFLQKACGSSSFRIIVSNYAQYVAMDNKIIIVTGFEVSTHNYKYLEIPIMITCSIVSWEGKGFACS